VLIKTSSLKDDIFHYLQVLVRMVVE